MAECFDTDNFRGETSRTLTVKYAYKIGRFLGWYCGREYDGREEGDGEQGDREQVNREHKTCRVVIGKDARCSSYMLEYVLVAGLTTSGVDAYLLHMTTTPSVSYVARTGGFDCGVMISANHNPYYDNGTKLTSTQGGKIDEGMILQVGAYLDGIFGEIPLTARERISRIVDHATDWSRYTGYLISLATRSYRNMKVGSDCANGSIWIIAKNMFDALGTSICVISNEPDGLDINTGCGSTHMEGLIRFVKEKKLDMGFAFDGDADRCLRVDEKGNLVDGDSILYTYGCYMKERGKLAGNRIVTTVMSNFGPYKALDEASTEYEKIMVGDKYVYENIALNGYRTGGEQSGHIIFRKYTTTRDGILTATKVVEVILEKEQPLSRLAEPVHIYPQILGNIRVKDKQAVREGRDVQDAVNRMEQELGTKGRVLVRENSMRPVMRIMVEARDGCKCREYVDQIIRVMVDKDHQDVLS